MEFCVENVRSFCGRHVIPIKPLTLLVGENSTGKSTLLALLHTVLSNQFPSIRQSFSSPPYDLGSFENIVTYKGGRFGRASSFSVGLTIGRREIRATYSSDMGQPILKALSIVSGRDRFEAQFSGGTISGSISIRLGKQQQQYEFSEKFPIPAEIPLAVFVPTFVISVISKSAGADNEQIVRRAYSRIFDLMEPPSLVAPARSHVRSLAPVRTRPKRTYDEVSDDFEPEGGHVPYVLARLASRNSATLEEVEHALSVFGRESGLFSKVSIRKLGRSFSSPFQIQVKKVGPAVNISDVGYGASQVLPVIVESVLTAQDEWLLLQQPEVHLHPRAQAALGSFFVTLATKSKKHFVIETHSDYLIDRVRLQIARGTIDPENVQLLFFDKPGLDLEVHRLSFDSGGNVLNAPACYREFFLQEEMEILMRPGA